MNIDVWFRQIQIDGFTSTHTHVKLLLNINVSVFQALYHIDLSLFHTILTFDDPEKASF